MEYSENDYRRLLEELFARHPSVQGSGFTPCAHAPSVARAAKANAVKNFFMLK